MFQPYVAYDYDFGFKLEQVLEFKYKATGGDYGAIVVAKEGGFLQVTEEKSETPSKDIIDFNDSCNIQVKAGAGVRGESFQPGIFCFHSLWDCC